MIGIGALSIYAFYPSAHGGLVVYHIATKIQLNALDTHAVCGSEISRDDVPVFRLEDELLCPLCGQLRFFELLFHVGSEIN